MATVMTASQLPWNEQGEDRLFKWLSGILVVVFLIAGIIFNLLTLPEPERRQLVDISPRLAQLILEQQQVEPKPEPEPIIPEKQEVEQKKEEVKEEPKPEPVKPKTQREQAREAAKNSGLLAVSDELADLRNSLDLGDLMQQPQQSADTQAVEVAAASNVLSAAGGSSGGITTNTLTREVTTSELSRRQVAKVESNITTKEPVAKVSKPQATNSAAAKQGSRNPAEINRIFEANKSDIFAIYNRALRKNPNLVGKVVVELTIASNGKVTKARIVSSELGDEDLERKLLLKLRRFQFANTGVAEATVTYPIDFLPS